MSILLAWLVVLTLTECSHYTMDTRLWPRQRSLAALLLQQILVSSFFLLFFLLTGRAWLSALLTMSSLVVVWVVNQAKFRALREPLVFSDFYLYLQVFTHPRLFLPFLNIPLTLLAISIGLGLLYLLMQSEPYSIASGQQVLIASAALILVVLLNLQVAKRQVLVFDPIMDVQQYGLYSSLLIYSLIAKHELQQQGFHRLLQQTPYAKLSNKPKSTQIAQLPDFITVQSESFFDVRRLGSFIKPDILEDFDAICQQAEYFGELEVPCWGANTLRSEFAFLTGLSNLKLNTYRYNPYQFLTKTTTFSNLVSFLRTQGYHCIAIHPNHRQFFKRDQVFPHLGFERFIDIHDFQTARKAGPYISDIAVYEKIQQCIQQRNDKRPLFIFAITMENHGPLHLEPANIAAQKQFYTRPLPKYFHELNVYLSHLNNANHMAKALTSSLAASTRPSFCCWYGDHVPSMPSVYKALNYHHGHSNYFIWSNQTTDQATTAATPLRIEELGLYLLRAAGFNA